MDARIAAVICAAGSSSRMGGVKKEYRPLGPVFAGGERGKPLTVLGASVIAFSGVLKINGPIVITVPPGEGESRAVSALPENFLSRNKERVYFVEGGKSRRESVHKALSFLKKDPPDYALIHDGARPWVSSSLIENVITAMILHGAAVPVTPALETPKLLDSSGFVKCHLRRAELGLAQTPQGFAFPEILEAHEKAARRESAEGFEYTDDAEVWGEFLTPVAAVPGEAINKKITFPEDLI